MRGHPTVISLQRKPDHEQYRRLKSVPPDMEAYSGCRLPTPAKSGLETATRLER
jgi:hypothetical protein